MVNKDGWTDEQIIEWVTIIAIFLFVSFPHEMIVLSETSLGKLFFAFVIIYYAMVDPVYGVIACAVIIVYYHLDLYKSIISIHRDTLLSENMMMLQDSIIQDRLSDKMIMYSDITGALEGFEKYSEREADLGEGMRCDSGASITDPVNYYESEFLRGSKKAELLNKFRKEHCDEKRRLKNTGGQVKPDMADHVFSELRFSNQFAKCNPCDESCEFSIIEERINREEKVRPTSSKDEPIDWNQFFGHYLVKPITSMADDFYTMEQKVSSFILSA